MDTVASRKVLDIYIQQEISNYEIIRVFVDGLCILRAFKEFMEGATVKDTR